MKIIILGGGASGLMLANYLKQAHLDFLLIEKSSHVGKKILVSGNGKCNLSNLKMSESCYNHSLGYEISKSVNVLEEFEKLGLVCVGDQEGRVYPFSMTANSVLDTLRKNIEENRIKTSTNIIRIEKKGQQFVLTSDLREVFTCDILILATGGKTYYKDCNSYLLASILSHKITPLRPTLLPLKVKENLQSIENLRSKVKATLFANSQEVYQESGEVLYKKDALSGIVMFVMSSIIARNPSLNYQIQLDLVPIMNEEELKEYVLKFPTFEGLFPKMIAQYILKHAHTNDVNDVVYTIKHLTFNIIENLDFKNAQVTSGGVDIHEIDDGLQSKYISNLYFAGEIMDIDGICGGYNLHFAFSCAKVIAEQIVLKMENNS